MKKFLDITGLKTLVDWIKSKFNSVEKAQYVANRSFNKYTRKKDIIKLFNHVVYYVS